MRGPYKNRRYVPPLTEDERTAYLQTVREINEGYKQMSCPSCGIPPIFTVWILIDNLSNRIHGIYKSREKAREHNEQLRFPGIIYSYDMKTDEVKTSTGKKPLFVHEEIIRKRFGGNHK